MLNILRLGLAISGLVLLNSCSKDDDIPVEVLTPGPDMMVYGITTSNELVAFNAKTPGTFASKTAITGLGAGEKLLSIDFRPATGELYAVSDASKLYIVNTATATSRVVSATAFSPAISGAIVSIDFNPTVDRIRLVTNTGQNLRLHPETGAAAATDGNINGGSSPSITGIAYTNSVAGATSTTLFDVDVTTGKLYRQDPPNNGTLAEIGSLGFTFTGQAAFDISSDNTAALLAVNNGTTNSLYLVNTSTGAAGRINTLQQALADIAIPTQAVAYTVDATNNLAIFNPNNPVPVTKAISGLQAAETILGIDFRPANGQLYALGSTSRLYTINLGTGAATAVGAGPFSTLLSGTDFGFDFNPTVDRIRVVSNTGQNLRLNPNDGTLAATDGMLNPGTPAIGAAAYTNNFAGATTTSLFVIDHNTDKLYLQNPPNNGTLVEVGSLGINIESANGFDIGSTSQKIWFIGTVGGATKLYSINTTTGAATAGPNFPNGVKGFSVGLGF